MVSYLLALGQTFSFPLLFDRFSLCLSFVYLETMFGSHRPWLARYIGPLLVFLSEMESCLSWSVSLFFSKTAPRCSDSGIYFFFSGVFKVCGLSKVIEFCHFFNFLLIY